MAVILIFATVLAVIWLVLLTQVSEEDWLSAAYAHVLGNVDKYQKLYEKDERNKARLEQYHGVSRAVMSLLIGGDSKKQRKKLADENEQIQNGDLKGVSLLQMPGYVLLRRLPSLGRGEMRKKLLAQYSELSGSKYAVIRTDNLLAQISSYVVIGTALVLVIGTLLFASGNQTMGLAVYVLGFVIVLVLVYALYDEVADRLKKRREAIARQFPNVVSKLALLVTSGMIMDKAWKETAQSQETELYMEMRKTSDELDNLVSPDEAYTNFLNRCNTKETTKLASAIIQNQSKGNAEVGALLKNMAHEAWQERRHTAKRDAEASNSKLMIPTMLLFLAILVMIMVPVALNFSAF